MSSSTLIKLINIYLSFWASHSKTKPIFEILIFACNLDSMMMYFIFNSDLLHTAHYIVSIWTDMVSFYVNHNCPEVFQKQCSWKCVRFSKARQICGRFLFQMLLVVSEWHCGTLQRGNKAMVQKQKMSIISAPFRASYSKSKPSLESFVLCTL